MDFPNFEKQKVFKSKIPVRGHVKPLNRKPGLSSASSTVNRNGETCQKSDTFVKQKVATEAKQKQNNVPNASLPPKVPLPSKDTRLAAKAKCKTTVEHTKKSEKGTLTTIEKNLPSSRLANVASKNENKRATNIVTNIPNKRFTNYALQSENKKSTSTVSKSVNNRLTNITKSTANNKPAINENTFANRRLTNARSQNENKRPTGDLNRRLTNFASNKPPVIERNAVSKRLTNTDKIELKKSTNVLGTKNKLQINEIERQQEVGQRKTRNVRKGSENVERFQNKFSNKTIRHEDKQTEEDILFDKEPTHPLNVHLQTDVEFKENLVQQSTNHVSQPNIEFEADERFRNLILCGKELTPSILKSCSNVKYSSVYERGSFFKTPHALQDPYKTALKAIEKLDLASEGERMSRMKMNVQRILKSPLQERNSFYKQLCSLNDPFQAALKAIEKTDLAAEDRRVSEMKRNPPRFRSPIVERQSIFFNNSANPFETALKRLEVLQMKKKVESTKKVTFGLTSSGSAPKAFKNDVKIKSSTFEPKLKDGEKNQEGSQCLTSKLDQNSLSTLELQSSANPSNLTSVTDKVTRTPAASHYKDILIRVCGQANGSTTTQETKDINVNLPHNSCLNKQTEPILCEGKIAATEDEHFPSEKPLLPQSAINNRYKTIHSAISESVGPCLKTFNRLPNSIPASGLRSSLYSSRSQTVMESGLRRSTLSRLCTPKPVSLYPQYKLNDSISPEFLCRRASNIILHAPISTPMVLRNLAEDFDNHLSTVFSDLPIPISDDQLSPVCQRLDFDEIEKETGDDTPKGAEDSKEIQNMHIQGILTNQKILDHQADEECSIFLANAPFPMISGRNLQNPIAQILRDGDDMHYVPVELK